jgi:hypothetical protein
MQWHLLQLLSSERASLYDFASSTHDLISNLLWKYLFPPPLPCFNCFLFLSYYCCSGGTLWHLQKCLQYILVRFAPSIILLYSLSPILRIVSTGSHFSVFIQEYIVFPLYLPSSTFSLPWLPSPFALCHPRIPWAHLVQGVLFRMRAFPWS